MTPTAVRGWVGTSWKMNMVRADAVAYLTELDGWMAGPGAQVAADIDLAVFPAFTVLESAVSTLAARRREGPRVLLGGQNMHCEARGAKTGEISAELLVDTGVQLVELGHFERRTLFNETDRTVNCKVLAALKAGLRPVVCVGDNAFDRACGASAESVARQVKLALAGVHPDKAGQVVIAYEPGWAIGTEGVAASPDEALNVIDAIRRALVDCFGPEHGPMVRVVYGGSVSLANIEALSATSLDGVFVGRAALDVHSFITIARTFWAHLATRNLVAS